MRCRPRGQNLLETILACSIFASVTVSLIGIWASHSRALEKARHRLVGSYYAEQIMEDCLQKGWNHIDAVAAEPPRQIPLKLVNKGAETTVVYESDVSMTLIAGPPAVKHVSVVVGWEDYTGAHNVTYETIFTDT